MVYESEGVVDKTHDDLSGRVTVVNDTSGITDHATHVAGIVGGNGSLSGGTYRGMAPNVDIISYDKDNLLGDIEDEYNESIHVYGADIATNSWGRRVDSSNCDVMGDYTSGAQLFDEIVGGSLGKPIPIIFSAGNDRDDGDCGTDPSNIWNNYENVPPPHPAKNIITVGATILKWRHGTGEVNGN